MNRVCTHQEFVKYLKSRLKPGLRGKPRCPFKAGWQDMIAHDKSVLFPHETLSGGVEEVTDLMVLEFNAKSKVA